MNPVFANSAWVPAPERMILRSGRWRRRLLQVRYGVFMHPTVGAVVIDTGYTAHSLSAKGRSFGLRSYSRMLGPQLVEGEQADPFLAHFGLTPADVSIVIVTHFHADHVSGLAAFPNARFISSGSASAHVQNSSAFQNVRHGVFSELIPADFSERLDPIEKTPLRAVAHFPAAHDIFGDGSVLAVPLPGHAAGHMGLLFEQRDVPLLYATDTQWVHAALPESGRPTVLPRLISNSYQEVARSSDQVDAFAAAGGAVVLCHDDAPSPFDHAHGALL